MFNNANVLYRCKFVDGVSTVQRFDNTAVAASIGANAEAANARSKKAASKKAAGAAAAAVDDEKKS